LSGFDTSELPVLSCQYNRERVFLDQITGPGMENKKHNTEWDTQGNITKKSVYDADTDKLMEVHEFDNGKPVSSKIYGDNEELYNYYFREINPPVISHSISFRNGTERTNTFFDETGKLLYSLRLEEVNEWSRRRYYNDHLVYEGMQDPDPAKAPINVQYYNFDGAVLIDYTSYGNGTGVWRLYDNTGKEVLSVPEAKEGKRNQRKRWDIFMPEWYYIPTPDTLPDWEVVASLFKAFHDEYKKL
jgi:hypothetical protein